MEPSSTMWISRVAAVLLVGLFAVNVYRAATQSITTEEAATFERWVRPPLRDVIPQPYDPNNHILNTVLIKRAVGLFRLSEFSFRLPSLLGGALYLWVAYRLSRRLLGTGSLALAGVVLLSLHPLVLDYLSAARGYGMALAFWMWSLEFLLDGRRLSLAGVCLGLSPAASLAFLWPATALGIALVAARRASIQIVEQFAIPAVVTGFIILAIPLSHAQAGNLSDHPGLAFIFVPPASLAALTVVRKVDWKPLTFGAIGVAGMLALWYLSQFRVGFYGPWPQDAGAKSLVQVLRRDADGATVEIGASRGVEPILSFYQARYRQSNWKPLQHRPVTGDFDYYVLRDDDAGLAAERHLDVLYRVPGMLLARKSRD